MVGKKQEEGSQIIEGGRILWILWVGSQPPRWQEEVETALLRALLGRGRCTPATCRTQMLTYP